MNVVSFFPRQVKTNVENWQFESYAKSQGIDPETLSNEQKTNLKLDMTRDLYPGESTIILTLIKNLILASHFFKAWTEIQIS